MRVPVDLITGFLGSGKTTFLRHLLRTALPGRKIAVIVNDIGDLGMDGRVIEAAGLQNVESMVELDSGCICCSIDARFQYAVQEIVEVAQPDLVLVESTGLADPAVLIEKIADTVLGLDAVITVVDAVNLDLTLRESVAARAQVGEADFLVVNKIDLVSDTALEDVRERLYGLNPRALQVCATFGAVRSRLLFGTSVGSYRQRASGPSRPSHLEDDGIEAMICEATGCADRARFEDFLSDLPAAVCRAKGIVHFRGEASPSLFNLVCGRHSFQWLPRVRISRDHNEGVFLGREVHRLRAQIEHRFRSCFALSDAHPSSLRTLAPHT